MKNPLKNLPAKQQWKKFTARTLMTSVMAHQVVNFFLWKLKLKTLITIMYRINVLLTNGILYRYYVLNGFL